MPTNWKLIALIACSGIIISLIIIITAYQFIFPYSAPKEQIYLPAIQPQTTSNTNANQISLPVAPATGDIDDTINALLETANLESATFEDEDTDTSLIDIDKQAISDFGQANDENQF